jgi:hypothetical protein
VGATGASYTTGVTVNLTVTPSPGYYFLNWSNCDNPSGTTCAATATSGHATITANFSAKKVTTLSLTPPSQSLTLNQQLTVSGRLALVPDNPAADLNGQTINVNINGPSGKQDLTATTSDISGSWSLPLTLFSQKGSYYITASYTGTEKQLAATSNSATILVAKTAGYAIIVQGKISSNEGLLDHQHTTDLIHGMLIRRLFSEDNITYLKSSATSAPTKAAVQAAITDWAKTRMNASPAPLVVVLVDHGDPGQFHLGSENITPQDLAGWLGALDSSLTAEARAENQLVFIGACYSGSFIPALSRPGRIIVTSASATEQSIRGTIVGFSGDIKIRQGEAFMEELFTRIGSGIYLGDAFKQAMDVLNPKIRITNGLLSSFWDNLSQHALIDANGDGKGSYIMDGTAVAKLITGDGAFNAGSNPTEISATTATSFLQSTQTSSLLWLSVGQDNRVDSAWIEIRKPDTSLPTSSGSGQIIIDLQTVNLVYNATLGRWEATYTGFTAPGKYEIYYYTKDSQTGEISSMKRSLVYKNTVTNNAPSAFGLTTPTDATTQKTVLIFGWQQSSDPDKDTFTYTLQISKDITFATVTYQKEEITDTLIAISSEAGLEDLSSYYWRVIAIDQYGGQKISTQTWSFNTNNSNGLPAIITGYVRNSVTGAPISGAKLDIGSANYNSLPNGAYLFFVPAGSVRLTVSATGYGSNTLGNLVATSGKIISNDIFLIASVATNPGDCDYSGSVTIAEVQSAINMFLGLKAVDVCVDTDSSTSVSIAEVQKVINSFLGL